MENTSAFTNVNGAGALVRSKEYQHKKSIKREGEMEQITQIEVRPDKLIEALSMAVLHCRQEIHTLDYDAASVLDDIDEYRRLIRLMDTTLDVLEAVADFQSTRLVKISGDGGPCKENDDD